MYITLKHHQLPKDILQQLLALFVHLNTWSICETSRPAIPTTTAWIQAYHSELLHSVRCFNSTSGIWIILCYCCTEFVPCPLYLILQDQTLLFLFHLNLVYVLQSLEHKLHNLSFISNCCKCANQNFTMYNAFTDCMYIK